MTMTPIESEHWIVATAAVLIGCLLFATFVYATAELILWRYFKRKSRFISLVSRLEDNEEEKGE